jgi:diguanylate cyclase
VLLPDAGERATAAVTEDLRAAVGARPIDTQAGGLDVTVSVGWATWDGNTSARRLVARADVAMYRAKTEGRDLVRAAAVVAA